MESSKSLKKIKLVSPGKDLETIQNLQIKKKKVEKIVI